MVLNCGILARGLSSHRRFAPVRCPWKSRDHPATGGAGHDRGAVTVHVFVTSRLAQYWRAFRESICLEVVTGRGIWRFAQVLPSRRKPQRSGPRTS